MMEIEPPYNKKTFFSSLLVVFLISSLFIGIFAGQAMGQSENDSKVSEPLSIVRIIGSVIVTIGIIILIVKFFTGRVKRNTAKINSSPKIKPLPNAFKRLFLILPTLFFYLAYFNADYAEKFNVMSRRVLKKDSNIHFPVKRFSILLSFSFFIIIFAVANVFLLNPSVYAALFNSDGMAFGAAVEGGFAGLGLLFNGWWIVIVVVAEIFCFVFCLGSALLFIGTRDTPMRQISIELLKYCMENSEKYYNACGCMLNKYANGSAFFSTDGLNYEAFKILIRWYNEEFSAQQPHERE
jgi:hypothetical protein